MRKSVETKEEKKEFTLEEAFVLWRSEAKSGTKYLSGFVSEKLGKTKLIGFFNTNKKNPKEADVRIYELDKEGKQGEEIASLWSYVSKDKKPYLTGVTNEKEKLVAFYGDESNDKRPYIRAYFQED